MKYIVLVVSLLAVLPFPIMAQTSVRRSGDCKLQLGKPSDDSKAVTVSLESSGIQAECKIRVDDFFGQDVVIANPTIKNMADKPLSVAYHVAVFNQGGELIGCSSQEGTVEKGAKNHQFGSCIMKIPLTEIAKVASYKISLYVSEPKPKK